MNHHKHWIIFTIIITVLLSLSCQVLSKKIPNPTEIISPLETLVETIPTLKPELLPTLPFEPTAISIPTEIALPTIDLNFIGTELSQWAFGAMAGSSYGDPSGNAWTANQAAGKPDTPQCGDYETTWASQDANSLDWIELYYDVPVIPTRVNIYQTYNPNQVVKVSLKAEDGEEFQVYDKPPKIEETCPYNLSIPISGIEKRVVSVYIEVDQTILNMGWDEIDAVELVGIPEDDSLIIPFSLDNIEFFPSEILPAGSFYYEISGDMINDAVIDNTVIYESQEDTLIFGFSRSDGSILLMLYLPKDIKPDTHLVIPYFLAPGVDIPQGVSLPTAQLIANEAIFTATTGAIRIYDYANGFMNGSFTITFTHSQLPGNTLDVTGAFNEIEVK
jgi:hypothetical protein